MSPPEEAELAAELRRIKDRAGLTLSQLATRTWYSRSSLDRYMNGKVFPPRRVVEAISDSCGADTDAIIAVWERAWSRRRDRPRGADTGATPMELPADLPDFTGRRAYRAAIEAQLLEDGSAAPAVAVISGMAGAGKTALAVHVAHRLRADLPDGQLYLHLAGMSAHPMRPRAALGQLLRSLGVEGSGMPDGVDERAALYRTRLSSRRMLIVADDAASADQVRPLIPGTATSSLIVTSRTRLAELAGARLHQLEPFRPDEALELLSELVGAHRVDADPERAARIVSWCGNLPLAIRIAGARLVGGLRPELDELATRLADERHRLTELAVGDLAVRSSLELSFRALPAAHRAALIRFAELEFASATPWMIAALTGQPMAGAELTCDRLVTANLLIDTGRDGAGHRMLGLHDLVRHYAREQARLDPPGQRVAALERLLGGWLTAARRAELALNYRFFPVRKEVPAGWWPAGGPPEAPAEPMRWYLSNRRSLLYAVRLAAEAGQPALGSALATVLTSFFSAHSDWGGWQASHKVLRGDPHVLRGLGELDYLLDRSPEATATLTEARARLEAAGDQESVAYVNILLGVLRRKSGNFTSAARYFDVARRWFADAEDDRGLAQISFQLGVQRVYQKRYSVAAENLRDALDGFRSVNDSRAIAATCYWLGVAHREEREPAVAKRWLDEAEKLFLTLSDRASAALCLREKAELLRQEARLDEATGLLVKALGVARELGEPASEMTVLHGLGNAIGESDPQRGVEVLNRALGMAETLGRRLSEDRIKDSLATLERRLHKPVS
jgi:tetratricopeptide (TPR) repeat protein/transcriptional regulator with XRE-family HTH domain